MTQDSLAIRPTETKTIRRDAGVKRADLLDALHESNRSGKLASFVEGVSRLAGARWTRLSYRTLMGTCGLSRGAVARWVKDAVELELVERREIDGRVGDSLAEYEYRIAERFHRRRKTAA